MTASMAQGGERQDPRPGPQGWDDVIGRPRPGQHIAQLYTEHEFLARAVGRFVHDGLTSGDGVVVIATALHWRVIARRLTALGVNVQQVQRNGQLLVRDADETLQMFVVAGVPDRARFREVTGGFFGALAAAGYPRIRAFGEMVDRLRHHDLAATFEIERFWDELLAERGITLLCAYSVDAFDARNYRGVVQRIASAHSDLVPAEDYARLDRAVERGYAEVFGSHADALALRQAFLRYFARPAAMPDAEAAILALRAFMPDSGDDLIASVRLHYHALPA